MKKQFFLTVLFSLFLLLNLGCQNAIQGVNTVEKINTKPITIYIASDEAFFVNSNSKSANSRTITPSALNSSELDFYLSGVNKSTSQHITQQKVNFISFNNSTTEGMFVINLKPDLYDLTISACNKDETLTTNTKLLTGTTFCNLYTENTVHFVLTSNIKNSFGSANITISTLDWEKTSDTTVTLGIYKKNNESSPIETKNISTFPYIYTNDSIATGTYTFKLAFRNNQNMEFYYTETLFIEPNRSTVATLEIPKIIMELPIPPTNLTFNAKTSDNKYNEDTFYPITFTWQDNSINETNFYLDIICYDEDNYIDKRYSFYNIQIESNIQEYTHNYLQKDRKYKAKLWAENSAGKSDYIEAVDFSDSSKTEIRVNWKKKNFITEDEINALSAEEKEILDQRKLLEEKHRLESNKNVLLYKSESDSWTASLLETNRIALGQYNNATISVHNVDNLVSPQYIYFVLRNVFATDSDNTGTGSFDTVFTDVNFLVSEQGCLPFIPKDTLIEDSIEYEYEDLESGFQTLDKPSAKHSYLRVPITQFEVGKTYNIIYKATAKADTELFVTSTVILNFVNE